MQTRWTNGKKRLMYWIYWVLWAHSLPLKNALSYWDLNGRCQIPADPGEPGGWRGQVHKEGQSLLFPRPQQPKAQGNTSQWLSGNSPRWWAWGPLCAVFPAMWKPPVPNARLCRETRRRVRPGHTHCSFSGGSEDCDSPIAVDVYASFSINLDLTKLVRVGF